MKPSGQILTALAVAAALATFAGPAVAAEHVVTSPGGRTEIRVSDESGQANFAIKFNGETLIAPSPLGLALDKGGSLSRNLKIVGTSSRKVDESYELVVGKARSVRDRFTEATVEFLEAGGMGRRLKVIARAYDDGVAFRYVLPDQPNLAGVAIRDEETRFDFAPSKPDGDDRCWALNLGRFGTSHEGEYDPLPARSFRASALYELPVVCQTAKGATFAIAEADLKNYAGLYLTGRGDGGLGLQAQLSPRLDDPGKAVLTRIGTDTVSPWRVVMVGATPGDLVASNLMTSLNPPTALTDTSWIKPGKAAGDWWNGARADGAEGMNDATMKRFIDFAAANRLEYMLIDDGWYVGSGQAPKVLPGTDVTRAIPAIDVPGLIAYGRERGVGVMLWVHWKALDAQMDEALAAYEAWGVKGIKVDFMDRDDQQMVDFYHRLLTKAGEHRLMVDLHGAYRPTGLVRTYPHYVTQEGVLGAEYNKWSRRITATHNVTLPFTRMLLGPMDYTPGGFRNVAPRDFKDQFILPTVQTTRGQALAMYVVYDSPLTMVSDSPLTYAASPAGLDFISAVPTSWDETRVLSGEIGRSIVVARRKGADWWVGAMTNETGRTVKVPLTFLGDGAYSADIRRDGTGPTELEPEHRVVSASNVLSLKLAPSGGGVIHLSPAN